MSSDVIDALNATKTILQGLAPADVTALKNIYVYPDDYANVDDSSVPFMVIQESVGRSSAMGDIPTGGTDVRGWHDWAMELVLYLNRGENEWPSSGAASAELQHRNWVIVINDLLSRNQTLGGTVFSIGEKRGQAFALADYLIDHEQWNQKPFWSIRFLVPITQIYDRGG
jgi:hypothetical protein